MSRPLTPSRLLLGLGIFVVFECVLSMAGFHYAKQAKAHLQHTFPTAQVQLKGAAWVMSRCGSFHLGDEAEGQTTGSSMTESPSRRT